VSGAPSIPASADAIDARWLEEALAPRHPGVRVRAVEVRARQEWTNAHAWLRLSYDDPAGAPPTLFCKLPPAEPARRAAIAATGMGLREALFYERLAPRLGLRTPLAHAVRYDAASGDFVILLEDLLAGGCTVSDGPTGIAPQAAAGALADLAQLHLRFEEPARRAAEAAWVPPPVADTDYGAGMLRYGLEHHRARLSERFAELAELYIAERPALHALWADGPGPLTVIHGDAHIGNLFMDGDRLGFYDWGMLQQGRGLRDVSYFLTMSLAPAERRAHEAALLRRYLDERAARGGARIAFADAWQAHRLYASYAVVACCQVVTFPENATPKRRVFAASLLARAEGAIAELGVREALREARIGD